MTVYSFAKEIDEKPADVLERVIAEIAGNHKLNGKKLAVAIGLYYRKLGESGSEDPMGELIEIVRSATALEPTTIKKYREVGEVIVDGKVFPHEVVEQLAMRQLLSLYSIWRQAGFIPEEIIDATMEQNLTPSEIVRMWKEYNGITSKQQTFVARGYIVYYVDGDNELPIFEFKEDAPVHIITNIMRKLGVVEE